jgi:hypothetical protein
MEEFLTVFTLLYSHSLLENETFMMRLWYMQLTGQVQSVYRCAVFGWQAPVVVSKSGSGGAVESKYKSLSQKTIIINIKITLYIYSSITGIQYFSSHFL